MFLYHFPTVQPAKFWASHSQHGWWEAQWGNFKVLEKYSWSPNKDHTTALHPLGCRGWPLLSQKGLPFSKGLPSGSTVGCVPFPRLSKDHFSHFQRGGQVLALVQLLGKLASKKCFSKLPLSPSKLPQEKTRMLSLFWKATPSPCMNSGMVFSFQCFSKHIGWPGSLSSPDFSTPDQNFSKSFPFPKVSSNMWW